MSGSGKRDYERGRGGIGASVRATQAMRRMRQPWSARAAAIMPPREAGPARRLPRRCSYMREAPTETAAAFTALWLAAMVPGLLAAGAFFFLETAWCTAGWAAARGA